MSASHPRSAARVARGWLLREPDHLAESLLFCVPYLGTGASMFHSWPRRLGGVEVCPLQPPGRENRMREPSHETYEQLADDLVDSLEPYLHRPFALFAHCNSAYVGYEVVRRLSQRGLPLPVRLIISSMVPPDLMPFGSILDVPEDDLGDIVAGLMRARGFDPDPELVELALDPMAADVLAYRNYQPDSSRLPCPLTVVSWSTDSEVPPGLVCGWSAFADAEIRALAGDHWTFLSCPDELKAILTQACRGRR